MLGRTCLGQGMPNFSHGSTAVVSGSLQAWRPNALPKCQARRDLHVAKAAHGPNCVVVGAGVIGLTAALRLLREIPGSNVRVVAGKFGTETTTAGAAGVWGPYKLNQTPEELVERWGGQTFEHLMQLFHGPDAERAGVSLVQTHYLFSEPTPPPSWHKLVHGFQAADPKHLQLMPDQYRHGYSFNNITCEGRYYLQYLTDAINVHGHRAYIQKRNVEVWADLLSGYDEGRDSTYFGPADFVINCTGLLASQGPTQDPKVHPIRGQVIRVKAPWVTQCYMAGDYYIIPNRNFVVLGGTGQVGNWSEEVDEEDKLKILQGCYELLPSLRYAEVLEDWVGLRPGRPQVRLEVEQGLLARLEDDKPVPVVHNYGHGGAGLTLGWGCAGDVVKLVRDMLP